MTGGQTRADLAERAKGKTAQIVLRGLTCCCGLPDQRLRVRTARAANSMIDSASSMVAAAMMVGLI